MITKLPNNSTTMSQPLWNQDRPQSLSTSHRTHYKGHFHKTKIPGPDCLRAESQKPKVSAYLSTLPLSPPEHYDKGLQGKNWLEKTFQSKEVKWRRGNNLKMSQEPFEALSHYHLNFPPKSNVDRKIYIPKHIPLKTKEKFNAISTYNSDFYETPHCKEDICFKMNPPKVQDLLTWKLVNPVPAVCESKRKELPPLEIATTYRTQFQRYLLPVSEISKKSETYSPKCYKPFDSRSTYQSDFSETVFQDKSPKCLRFSSYGALRKANETNDISLAPYLEYQKTFFNKIEH